jgi:Tfp pilus assembly protein PilF
LEKDGYDKVASVANSLQKTKKITFVENEISSFGYWLIAQDKIQKALNVFMLNTQLFPESSNTFHSLAEIHLRLNNIPQAINSYDKTLQLEPQNNYVKAQLARLKKVSIK